MRVSHMVKGQVKINLGLWAFGTGPALLGLMGVWHWACPAKADGLMAGLGPSPGVVTRGVKPIGKWALDFNLTSLPSRAVALGGCGAGLVARIGADPSQ